MRCIVVLTMLAYQEYISDIQFKFNPDFLYDQPLGSGVNFNGALVFAPHMFRKAFFIFYIWILRNPPSIGCKILMFLIPTFGCTASDAIS